MFKIVSGRISLVYFNDAGQLGIVIMISFELIRLHLGPWIFHFAHIFEVVEMTEWFPAVLGSSPVYDRQDVRPHTQPLRVVPPSILNLVVYVNLFLHRVMFNLNIEFRWLLLKLYLSAVV